MRARAAVTKSSGAKPSGDLFARPAPPFVAPPRRESVRPTGRFVADPVGGAAHFVHDCGACGAANAAFGADVHLLEAIDSGDASRAGVWLCWDCWRARR